MDDMGDGPSPGCLLGAAICCFSAALVILALLIWGPEVVAALFLAVSASVGVTVCLAMMADGGGL